MRCPFCGKSDSKVIDSRPTDEGNNIRRRRECIGCGKRFTTYEKIETVPLRVIKKDGSRELFDSEKLIRGLTRACEKRPVSIDQLRSIADKIENDACSNLEKEISTAEIGKIVMEALKQIDDVSYVRFASVYREFKDINTFVEELNQMLKSKK